ncbi:hypothetical protein FZEAL_7432 [Fusarium zealandicum]|uniref:Uncharacterized protein n=1 Tax=Fusarium zealandicum TaxID=1053134 RepID=A0A8H4UG26_9HYPO|nr:hypothetical protein FZEAL_7432 [Fusarium zealandicum]
MLSSKRSISPYRDFHTCGRNFAYEQPSPLRIVKGDSNVSKDNRELKSHSKHKHDGARGKRDIWKGEESPTMPKRRKLDRDHGAPGKENLRKQQDAHDDLGFGDRQALHGAKSWTRDWSPPRRPETTSSSQLTVRKKRQGQTLSRAKLPSSNASPSSFCSLPAGYGMSRSVKPRPPLANIFDQALASASTASSPSSFHAPGREEDQPPPSRPCPSLDGLAPLRQPRLVCVLVPHVVITPQVTALEGGQHDLWAAIEIIGRLWPVAKKRAEPGPRLGRSDLFKDQAGLSEYDQRGGPFEFGRLDNLSVQVRPTANSSLIRVLQNQTFPMALPPGSSILLLAQVQINVKPATRKKKSGHCRQISDDLIEDLETELGGSQMGYMEVQLSYRHPAFPTSRDVDITGDRISSIQSKIETAATASVKLHNSMSPWSPVPASTSNPLLPLIEKH